MATATSDSLFSVSQSFLSPDILQKISKEINQPIEQTKVGLKSVIPTLLMGIVNKGSTKEGAETLVNMATKQSPSVDLAVDPAKINEGNEVVNGIFGNNLNSIISKLGTTTGMNTGSITKMLGMAAPMIMGVIGSKIKNEKLNASGLMSFLGQQKTSLMGLIPAGIPGLSGLSTVKTKVAEKTTWPKIVLVALAVAGAGWWFSTSKFGFNAPAVKTISIPSAPFATGAPVVQSISALQDYMNTASVIGATRRFRFEGLNFTTGSTKLMSGSEYEINQIAAAMKAHPGTTARIEGYTDNVGSAVSNQVLSSRRASAVKDELIARGISAGRIEAVGMGAMNPIESNTTAEGRAANRRIEFIIKR